jgi:hypothetical protein
VEQREEKVLKGMAETTHGFRIALAALCGALCLAVAAAPGAGAGTATAKTAELPARVIAHLPLLTAPGDQMVLQKQGDKRYLYIQRASRDGYIIVDVTQPEFAGFVTRQTPADAQDSTVANAAPPSQDAAVPDAPDPASKTAIRSISGPPEIVKVMDISDPDKPTTLETIKNVTCLLADGTRGIFYVTTEEGLWVLKHNREQIKVVKKKPPCNMRPDAPVIQDCDPNSKQ